MRKPVSPILLSVFLIFFFGNCRRSVPPADELLQAEVLLTIVDGRVVFERGAAR
jgi:hypothetical protein